LVYFGRNGKGKHHGVFYGHYVYSIDTWCISWAVGIFFSSVFGTQKNLATLMLSSAYYDLRMIRFEKCGFWQNRKVKQAKPTIVSYNARAVKKFQRHESPSVLCNKNIFFYFEKRSSLPKL
jgi:hypothetical protein